MKKNMGTALERAMDNPTKHNRAMAEKVKEIEAEASEEQAVNDELMQMLTATKTTRSIASVALPGNIKVQVYSDLGGEQERLLAKINSVATSRADGAIPDIEGAIDSAINLAASLVVHEEGRDWDDPDTWSAFHQSTSLEKLLEIIGIMLEPYRQNCKQMERFRSKR